MYKNNWLDSVYSDGSKFFVNNPLPNKGEMINISLQVLENNDLEAIYLVCKQHGSLEYHKMEVKEKWNGLDIYSCEVEVKQEILSYQFYLVCSEKIYYYTQHKITDYLTTDKNNFKILANYPAPTWVQSSVFYQIFPDRFYNSRPDLDVKVGEYELDGSSTIVYNDWNEPPYEFARARNLDFYNGDLYGVIEKLDYLQELGVNAIYLNPIFLAPTSHKYDTLDFFQVDPHLGGNQGFIDLMNEVHARGMKLVLDISIDHTSQESKWFNKSNYFYPENIGAYNNPNAEERNYYSFKQDGSYNTWHGVQTMPRLNFNSKELRKILYEDNNSVLKTFLRAPYKIDGWRFDVANDMANDKTSALYHEVWQEIFTEIKATSPDAYILAEDMTDSSEMYFQNGYDAAMNYFGFTRPLRGFLGEPDFMSAAHEVIRVNNVKLNARQTKDRILDFMTSIPYQVTLQQFNLINSHDIARIYTMPDLCRYDYWGALTMLFTFPGTASVYYGDELELEGNYNDVIEGARYSMNWDRERTQESFETESRYKRLISLKQEEEAFSDGAFKFIYANNNVLAYTRFSRKKNFIFVFSTDDYVRELEIYLSTLGLAEDMFVREVFDSRVEILFKDENMRVKVPPHRSFLFEFNYVD